MPIPIPNTKLFIPKSSIELVSDHFGELPHIKALREGKLLAGNSTKNVRLINGLVTKEWIAENAQPVLNELRGSSIAREIVKTLGQLHGLPEYLKRIHLPNAIGYESEDRKVLVTEYFGGAEELNNISAMQLPVELRASAALIVKSLGLNQFPTSSLLTRTGDSGIEECLIDLETAFSSDKADFTTEVFFSLLKEASKKDGSLDRFLEIISEGGSKWHGKLHDNEEQRILIHLLTETIGLVEGTSNPEEVIQALQTIITSFKNSEYAIEDITPHTPAQESAISFDKEFMERLVDKKKSLSRTGNDTNLLKEIIGMFADESRTLLSTINQSLERRDFATLKRSGHTLKTLIDYFCKKDDKALQAAIDLETAGNLQDYENSKVSINTLNSLMPDFCKAVQMLSTTV